MDLNSYKTTDLVLASVLSLEGMEVTIEVPARGRVIFTCSDPEERGDLKRIATDCLSGKLQVNPLSFAREMAEIRGRMYELLRLHRGSSPSRQDEVAV